MYEQRKIAIIVSVLLTSLSSSGVARELKNASSQNCRTFVLTVPETVQQIEEKRSSTLPFPSQKLLDGVLSKTIEVRVIERKPNTHTGSLTNSIKFTTARRTDIETFRKCLEIDEDEKTFGYCMCLGGPIVELVSRNKVEAIFSIHHGRAIRCNLFRTDANLVDCEKLVDWLALRGITEPREELLSFRESLVESTIEAQKRRLTQFESTIPKCIRKLLGPLHIGKKGRTGISYLIEDMSDNYAHIAPEKRIAAVISAVRADCKSRQEEIVLLLEWAGALPRTQWQGAYFGFPLHVLLSYEPRDIIEVARTMKLSANQWRGLCRYVCSWGFRTKPAEDVAVLTSTVKKRIRDELVTGGKDNESDIGLLDEVVVH